MVFARLCLTSSQAYRPPVRLLFSGVVSPASVHRQIHTTSPELDHIISPAVCTTYFYPSPFGRLLIFGLFPCSFYPTREESTFWRLLLRFHSGAVLVERKRKSLAHDLVQSRQRLSCDLLRPPLDPVGTSRIPAYSRILHVCPSNLALG